MRGKQFLQILVKSLKFNFVLSQISISKPETKPEDAPAQASAQIDYKKAFKTKKDSDLILKTSDGKTLQVHKEILVRKSPDFYLAIDWKNDVGIVSDFDYKTMNEFLRFVYIGDVDNLKKLANSLFKAAQKFKLPELEKICSDFIKAQ